MHQTTERDSSALSFWNVYTGLTEIVYKYTYVLLEYICVVYSQIPINVDLCTDFIL